MAKYNENFNNLKDSYLFVEIANLVRAFSAANPGITLLRMGIGDVTLPLAPGVVAAMQKAAGEMGVAETFRGYEDSGRGYLFLREAVSAYYAGFGVNVDADEIYITDGAKSDSGNIGDILSPDNTVLVTDPVYPVYVDANIMGGRKVIFADCNEGNNFAALPNFNVHADVIYLCSPNNPTGSVYTKEQLAQWVDYARANEAVIIFDAAYEAFISDDINPTANSCADKSAGFLRQDKESDCSKALCLANELDAVIGEKRPTFGAKDCRRINSLPRSIFAVPGARECAIEICSLSKTAGFTGTRCGYTVIPKELALVDSTGQKRSFAKLWQRRQGSKFNGVTYPVQRAAEAALSRECLPQVREAIDFYRANAKILTDMMERAGIRYTGGKHSPYVWFKAPGGMDSWALFDYLMNEIQVVGTPGSGFGKNGEGWFRLTAFGTRETTTTAAERFERLFK
jgi:LL-diaminopimelate aminotransferase